MAVTESKLLICLLLFNAPGFAQAECLSTVHDVKANNVNTRWRETTANDGRPMTIAIADGPNGLVYLAKKAGVPWLSGNITVCKSGARTDIMLKNTKTTTNVPMITRMGMPATQSAQIAGNQMRLAAGGWSGTFIGQ